jgi:hypothetical protein
MASTIEGMGQAGASFTMVGIFIISLLVGELDRDQHGAASHGGEEEELVLLIIGKKKRSSCRQP